MATVAPTSASSRRTSRRCSAISYGVLGVGGDPDRTLSLRYADLIAPLVRAVQQQQAEIEKLRAEVAALRR